MVRELQFEESKAPVAACGLVTVDIEPRVIAQNRALAIAAAHISPSPNYYIQRGKRNAESLTPTPGDCPKRAGDSGRC